MARAVTLTIIVSDAEAEIALQTLRPLTDKGGENGPYIYESMGGEGRKVIGLLCERLCKVTMHPVEYRVEDADGRS